MSLSSRPWRCAGGAATILRGAIPARGRGRPRRTHRRVGAQRRQHRPPRRTGEAAAGRGRAGRRGAAAAGFAGVRLADRAASRAGESTQRSPMKRIAVIVSGLIAVAGLAWLVWFKPAKPEEPEKPPITDVPVHVAQITRATLRGYVTAYGTVEPEPAGERPAASARVVASVAGVVSQVKCAEGQRVEQGALLFQLDTRAADVAVD